MGLVREIILARLLGTSIYSDALRAAIRIPNFLQNLFGEGVLSASFIPVYARIRKNESQSSASKLAMQLGIILLIVASTLGIFGIVFSNIAVELLANGFSEENKQITNSLIVYIFPATALLVMSAWCLGILNSHRVFFLSYSAPLIWNFSIISALLFYTKDKTLFEIAVVAAVGFLVGSFLQFIIQLPKTLSLIKNKEHTSLNLKLEESTKEVLRNFIPVIMGRGVIQISAYIDTLISTFLSAGSLSTLMYAQTIYLTPISVLGLSNAAATLPEFSEKNPKNASQEVKEIIIQELKTTINRVIFLSTISIVTLSLLGKDLIKIVFEHGNFKEDSTLAVHLVLLTFLIGIIPNTIGRVLTSLLFASGEQKLASRIAFYRLIISTILSIFFCFYLLPIMNVYEVAGIGLASSIASVFEIVLISIYLKRILNIDTLTFLKTPKNITQILICLITISLCLLDSVTN